ncbi:hypothetical protein D3C87_1752150 [compost metagenome]
MRCLDRHGFAGVRLPLFSESDVEVLVKFTCRVIGHVQDRRVGKSHTCSAKLQSSDYNCQSHNSGNSSKAHLDLHRVTR